MRLLDLFCKAGGAGRGYADAGFEVVGVDIEPQPRYPYEFHQGDALEFIRKHGREFDAIHASPPCQSFTAYRRRGAGVGDGYEDLIAPVRRALMDTGRPYVIENVQGAPLESAITLCGSMFGLGVRRHRLFESSVAMEQPTCRHDLQRGSFPPASNRSNMRKTCEIGVYRIPLKVQHEAMGGCEWMRLDELSNAVPPAYTGWIGERLLEAMR